MAGHRTEDLFGGDFYVESDDVTRGVELRGLSSNAFPPGKGDDPFAGNFEKDGFVDSFGSIDLLTRLGARVVLEGRPVEIPQRRTEGRSYLCAAGAAPEILEGLQDYFTQTCEAVLQEKAAKCSLKVELIVKYQQINLKVLFSQVEGRVAVSFVRKRGDAVDFVTTTTKAAAHAAARSGKELLLDDGSQVLDPPALNLPCGFGPPTGFLAPPLGFLAPPGATLSCAGLTEEDLEPHLDTLSDTADSEGLVALVKLLDSDPEVTRKALLARWASVEEQLRSGCVIASSALVGKVQPADCRCFGIAAERFPTASLLGRRQLSRMLRDVAEVVPVVDVSTGLDCLNQLRSTPEARDVIIERHLSEAELRLRSRSA